MSDQPTDPLLDPELLALLSSTLNPKLLDAYMRLQVRITQRFGEALTEDEMLEAARELAGDPETREVIDLIAKHDRSRGGQEANGGA